MVPSIQGSGLRWREGDRRHDQRGDKSDHGPREPSSDVLHDPATEEVLLPRCLQRCHDQHDDQQRRPMIWAGRGEWGDERSQSGVERPQRQDDGDATQQPPPSDSPATDDRNPGRMPCTIQIDSPLAGMNTMSERFR